MCRGGRGQLIHQLAWLHSIASQLANRIISMLTCYPQRRHLIERMSLSSRRWRSGSLEAHLTPGSSSSPAGPTTASHLDSVLTGRKSTASNLVKDGNPGHDQGSVGVAGGADVSEGVVHTHLVGTPLRDSSAPIWTWQPRGKDRCHRPLWYKKSLLITGFTALSWLLMCWFSRQTDPDAACVSDSISFRPLRNW